MKKYIKGIVLVVFMLLVFMPFMNVNASTEIHTINIRGIEKPVIGELPSTEHVMIDTPGITMGVTQWQTYSTSEALNVPFASDTIYGLYIGFEVEEGYAIANDATVVTNLPYEVLDERFPEFIYITYRAVPKYTVSFDTGDVGGTELAPVQVPSGNLLMPPEEPSAPGYNFVAWYKEPELINVFEFELEPVESDMTLYAKWEEVGDPHEPVYDIVFDYNGGTHEGNATETMHWVSFGYMVTLGNLMENVTAPSGKVLDYILVDDARYDFGTVLEINHNMTIKYIWRNPNMYVNINDVIAALNDSPAVMMLNTLSDDEDYVSARYDSDTARILIEADGELFMSFIVTDNSVYFEDNDTVVTAENIDEAWIPTSFVYSMEYAITTAAGYDAMSISPEYDGSAANAYATYGLEFVMEDYHFDLDPEELEEGMEGSVEGSIVRRFRMSFNRDLIDKLVSEYGQSMTVPTDPEVRDDLFPVLESAGVTTTTATLRLTVPGMTEEDEPYCYIERSTDQEDYELVIGVNCGIMDYFEYTDEDLTPNTTYYYKAFITGNGNESSVVRVTTTAANTPITKAPVVKATNGNNNTVVLTWNSVDGAIKYNVYRSTSKTGKFTAIATDLTETTYTSTGLTYGKTYYYKVKAVGATNYKLSSAVAGKTIPNKVENFTVPAVSANAIKLSWDKVATTGYQIQRSTNNKKWTTVKTITKNSTLSFVNTKLSVNKLYYYRIRAYKTVGRTKVYGPWTTLYQRTTPPKPKAGLSMREYEVVNITFAKTAGATHYLVEKSLDGENYTLLEDLPGPGVLADGGLTTGERYYYRVRACNNDLCGPWASGSIISSTVTPTLALKTTSKRVTVTIGGVEHATGYEIYRATSSKGKYTKVKTLLVEDIAEGDPLAYINATKKGRYYYYKVRAFVTLEDKTVYSSYSSVKKIRSK